MDDAESTAPPAAPTPGVTPSKAIARSARAQRLAAALRDNLKRRKTGAARPRPAKPSN